MNNVHLHLERVIVLLFCVYMWALILAQLETLLGV